MHFNPNKLKLFQKSVQYLGHTIDQNGLHKTKEKIQDILKIQFPENVSHFRQFLGMVNYFNNIIPNLASRIHLLTWLFQKAIQF